MIFWVVLQYSNLLPSQKMQRWGIDKIRKQSVENHRCLMMVHGSYTVASPILCVWNILQQIFTYLIKESFFLPTLKRQHTHALHYFIYITCHHLTCLPPSFLYFFLSFFSYLFLSLEYIFPYPISSSAPRIVPGTKWTFFF